MATRATSIKNRVRTIILLASVVVLLVTAGAFVIYEIITFKEQHVSHLASLAAVIADNSAVPLAFQSKTTAEEVLSALKQESDIVAAVVYDSEGKLFANYPLTLETNLLPARLESDGHHFSDDALVLFETVIKERKPIGTLYLRSSLRELNQRLWRYAGIVMVVLTGSLAAAFILSALLQRRITNPILALTSVAQTVSQRGDYSIRAPRMTEDELGTLTDAFNRMLAETQEHQGQLLEQTRLLDLSNDAIMVRDKQGRIAYWNRGAEELYGWKRADAVGRMKSELLHTEFSEPLEQINAALRQTGRWQGDLIQTRRDGTRIHINTRWAADRDAEGNLSGVLISDNDITPRKEAEEALRESEERFRALGDNIVQLAWMADEKGSLFWYNKRWYDFTGTTPAEMEGWGWEKVQHPEHLARVKAKWQSHLERGERWEDTFPLRSREGHYRWFLSTAIPIKNAQGRIVRWFGSNTDITEEKLSKEELERLVNERTAKLQETIGELEAFSYSISHDMRAPLRAMQGYANTLLEDYKDRLDPQAQLYLDRISRASYRLDALVQDVLAYSKIAKGEIILHSINLEQLIEELLVNHPEFLPPLAHIAIEKPLHRVLGHEAYLTQCVTNLLGNAIKFVAAGVTPEIRIRSERLENRVRVYFQDNGIGIDSSHQERIFQIFGQVHPANQYGGTGIGLAIVRKAAQRMDGEAGVKSELGKGSLFWISLKAAES